MMRLPALEDYDAGNGLVSWALTVARMSHPSYDEYFAAEPVPPQRSANEAAADASAAHGRYKAHRDRMVVEQAQAKERAKEHQLFKAEQARKRFEEERERQRVWAEGEAERVRMREIVREREAQWRLEQAEWDRVERERKAETARNQAALEAELRIVYRARVSELRKAAKQNKRIGGYGYGDASGHFIRIVRKNVNIGSGDTAIRMQVGELWEVNEYWMQTLLADNLAEYVFGWASFVASHK